jgi:hypothetical protein
MSLSLGQRKRSCQRRRRRDRSLSSRARVSTSRIESFSAPALPADRQSCRSPVRLAPDYCLHMPSRALRCAVLDDRCSSSPAAATSRGGGRVSERRLGRTGLLTGQVSSRRAYRDPLGSRRHRDGEPCVPRVATSSPASFPPLPFHPASRRRSSHHLVVGATNLHRGFAPQLLVMLGALGSLTGRGPARRLGGPLSSR